MAAEGNSLFVGGGFAQIVGMPRSYVAEFDLTTGQLTAWQSPQIFPPLVWAIAPSPDSVYIGGQFNEVGSGVYRLHIAELDRATGQPTSWNPLANYYVYDLELADGVLYVGGGFMHIGGQSRHRLAALDLNTGQALPWNPNVGDTVYDLEISDNTVYFGGQFVQVAGQARNRVAAVDKTTGLLTPWNPNANAFVRAVSVKDDVVYFGGEFINVGGIQRFRIAAVDKTTGAVLNWDPAAGGGGPNSSGFIYDIYTADQIYLSGEYSDIASSGHSYISAFAPYDALPGSPTPSLTPSATTTAAIPTNTPTATVTPSTTPTVAFTYTPTMSPDTATPTPTTSPTPTGVAPSITATPTVPVYQTWLPLIVQNGGDKLFKRKSVIIHSVVKSSPTVSGAIHD